MKKVYNKLVRDRIPEIIKKEGKNVSVRILSDDEFVSELYKKVKEEAIELAAVEGDLTETVKEISDVYEVIDALIDALSLDREEIGRTRNERKENRGAFKQKLFLESVEE
jgi:predicted house-cleaning noncanonical NTP pyrophosphatase (MazG superfamily)